jgi:penicillin V acylase-like amidase (Ntn superfamily)
MKPIPEAQRRAVSISQRRILATVALAGLLLLQTFPTAACSLIFINNNDVAKIVVRTMDLPLHIPEAPRFVVSPRGLEKDAAHSVLPGVTAKLLGLSDNHLKWKAKYGSVVMVAFDVGVTDGLNKQGLAGHLLTLETTAYEPKDDRPESRTNPLAGLCAGQFQNRRRGRRRS